MHPVRGRIIFNPSAGPRDVAGELPRVRRALRRCGWNVDVVTTHGGGDAIRLAREAAQAGLDGVWAAGGDGTVGEVANGLVGSATALGVLPVGTGNLWARQLHLPVYTLTHPFRLQEAAIAQVNGTMRQVDVGQINGRYFLLWAGIGFDAFVASEMEPRPRPVKRLGMLPYIIAAFTLARNFSGVRVNTLLDGRAVRGRTLMVLISNVQNYALFQVSDRARMDDGLLDVLIFKGLGYPYLLRHAAKLFSKRHLQDPQIVYRQVRRIVVQPEVPLSVQVDGDPLGTTPVTVSVVPHALRIMVPPHAPPGLFTGAGV